jgi:hypothetical protein
LKSFLMPSKTYKNYDQPCHRNMSVLNHQLQKERRKKLDSLPPSPARPLLPPIHNEKTTTQLALGDNHEDGKSRETSCLHMQQKLHFLEMHPISKKRFMRQGPDLIYTAST